MKNRSFVLLLMGMSISNCDKQPIAPTEPSGSPEKRAHHEMVYDEAGKSVLMISGSSPQSNGSIKFFNDIWNYDVSGWRSVGNAGDERSGIRLAYDSKRSKLFSFGGFTNNNQASGELREFENGDWKILSNESEMKSSEPGFVYDVNRDRLIAFGGNAGGGIVNNITWEWDGAKWNKFVGISPPGRQAFVMAYDTKRSRTILYGGMDGTGNLLEDDGVWEFDGIEWKNISGSDSPGARMASGYAYDSNRGMLIIFGGAGASKILGDTWAWNGIAWEKLADTGPSPRMMGYMAYDKHRDRIVLFGGRLGWPNDVSDTWEWDGSKWYEIKE